MKFPEIQSLNSFPREIVRPALTFICALVLWTVGFSLWSGAAGLEANVALQQRRLNQLIETIHQYKSLSSREKRTLTEDPIVVVSSLIGTMGLKDNLIQISSMSRGLNVQLGRMYMDKVLDFLIELDKRGLMVESTEIRSVPEGGSRMLSLAMVVMVAP